jgi:hypothetical protein
VLQHCCDDYQGNVGHDHCNLRGVSPIFQLQNPVAHCWSEQSHHKRKFCNVCRKRLEDSLSQHCESKQIVVHQYHDELALCGERISKRLLHLKVCNRLAATVAPVAASPRQSSTASHRISKQSLLTSRARKILTRGQMLAFQSASTLCTRSVRTLPPPTVSKMRPTCLACHCPTSATYITGAKET